MLIPITIILLIIYFSVNFIYAIKYIIYIATKKPELKQKDIIIGFFIMSMFGLIIKFYVSVFED